jgi:electron transport complex protein RnfB
MHTVIDTWCTGCALCLPSCPVDCIRLSALPDPVAAARTGWDAWSAEQADQARQRYARHCLRQQQTMPAQPTVTASTGHTAAAVAAERKAAVLQAARERARARQASAGQTDPQSTA